LVISICKHWCIDYKFNRLFFFFLFLPPSLVSFFLIVKLLWQQFIHLCMHLIQLISHVKGNYNLCNIFMECKKYIWFNRFIIFSRLFKYNLLLWHKGSFNTCLYNNSWILNISKKCMFFFMTFFQKLKIENYDISLEHN
jgi:hypothetical protein